jgi:hypothetical protein
MKLLIIPILTLCPNGHNEIMLLTILPPINT